MHPNKRNHRILVAPLNWGLGHASRSAALIRRLNQSKIWIASDGFPLEYLKALFPNLTHYTLPDYNTVSYTHLTLPTTSRV